MNNSDRLYFGFLQHQIEMAKLFKCMADAIKYIGHNMARLVEKMKENIEVEDRDFSFIQDKLESLQVSNDRLTRLEEAFDPLQFNSVTNELQGRR
jgi:hypothetical protein